MRRRPDQASVGFVARIPREDKAALDAVFPFAGKTWATQRGLEIFCDYCEVHPEFQTYVHDQILHMRAEGPPTNLTEFMPEVPRSLYNRFNSMFPEKGATTWFLRKFVPALTEQMARYERFDAEIRTAVKKVLGVPEESVLT